MHKQLFDQLTDSQKTAVCHVNGPMLILAGPGSGKTRVITTRIAALIESGVSPYRVCAITFTNKGAQEMRARATALGAAGGAHISTFHSLCVRVLHQYAAQAGIRPGFTVYDPADQKKCMKLAVKECELDTTHFAPAKMLNAVSTLKNRLISAPAYQDQAQDFFSKVLAQVYTRYQAILAEQNGLDFDDLLAKTAFLLQEDDTVCTELARRFQYIMIDEYQDTNHAQYRIAHSLALKHGNICATGDPDQSIYRWRGADIRNILAFEKDWPDALVVKLEENFRSSTRILEVADQLIAHNLKRKDKRLVPTIAGGQPVSVLGYEDELQESQAIAQKILQLTDNAVSLNSMAIFYRVNAMSRALEEALMRNRIPYQVVRGVEFYNRKEIKDILAYLKVLINPDDEISLLRIINTPARGLGKVTIEKVQAYAKRNGLSLFHALGQAEQIDTLSSGPKGKLLRFSHMLEGLVAEIDGPVAKLAEQVVTNSGLEESLTHMGTEGETALENLNELISATARYDQQTEGASLADYLQQISLFSDTDAYDASSNCVALMTLHAAKGLEFRHVFIVGLEEGLLPHERSSDDTDELEEERRLFFVGITRAKQDLNISYAKYRTVRGQMLRSIPSKFLSELGLDIGDEYKSPSEAAPVQSLPGHSSCAPFAQGELVSHAKFGLGRVQAFTDMGENSTVTVRFNSGDIKHLMLKYAKLSKPGAKQIEA